MVSAFLKAQPRRRYASRTSSQVLQHLGKKENWLLQVANQRFSLSDFLRSFATTKVKNRSWASNSDGNCPSMRWCLTWGPRSQLRSSSHTCWGPVCWGQTPQRHQWFPALCQTHTVKPHHSVCSSVSLHSELLIWCDWRNRPNPYPICGCVNIVQRAASLWKLHQSVSTL